MKFAIVFLLAFSLTATAVYALPDSTKTLANDFIVKIDGQIIGNQSVYSLKRDETIKFEASGLKLKTVAHIEIKKAGIPLVRYNYEVNETGSVEMLLDTPEIKIGATCKVTFQTANGETQTAQFKIKFTD